MLAMPNDNEADLVAPAFGCPVCSERNIDRLVWIDDDTVRCTMCGTEYDPSQRTKGGDDAAP